MAAALARVRRRGVRGVADHRHAALAPALDGRPVVDVVAQDLLLRRRLDHLEHPVRRAGEGLADVLLPAGGRVAEPFVHLRRGEPVDPVAAQRERAPGAPAAADLPAVARLERRRVHRREAAPAAVARVAGLVAEQLRADRRADAVGGDQGGAALLAAVRERQRHAAVLLVAGHRRAELHDLRPEPLVHAELHVRAQGDVGLRAERLGDLRDRHVREVPPLPVEVVEPLDGDAGLLDQLAEPRPLEPCRRVRHHAHDRAGGQELRRPLEDRRRHASRGERARGREAREAAACDEDAVLRRPVHATAGAAARSSSSRSCMPGVMACASASVIPSPPKSPSRSQSSGRRLTAYGFTVASASTVRVEMRGRLVEEHDRDRLEQPQALGDRRLQRLVVERRRGGIVRADELADPLHHRRGLDRLDQDALDAPPLQRMPVPHELLHARDEQQEAVELALHLPQEVRVGQLALVEQEHRDREVRGAVPAEEDRRRERVAEQRVEVLVVREPGLEVAEVEVVRELGALLDLPAVEVGRDEVGDERVADADEVRAGREERVEEGAGVAGQAPALRREDPLGAVRVVAHLEVVLDLLAPSLERARQLGLVLAKPLERAVERLEALVRDAGWGRRRSRSRSTPTRAG